MINYQQPTSYLSTSGPLTLAELTELRDKGVKTLINVRPDGESDDQIATAELSQWAKSLGMEYHFLPVVSGQYSPSSVSSMLQILAVTPQPIHAMCRTGTRAIHLWALASKKKGDSTKGIIAAGLRAGVDLTALVAD
jgi:sulfide:quinone oxidoreductase